MLEIRDLNATYGAVHAVRNASLTVAPGTVVAVLGPNGAGKSTLANAIAGLHKERSGCVLLDGRDLSGARSMRLVRAGIALVPQGRRVFACCTVSEHVGLARGRASGPALQLDHLLEIFPRLRDRWSVRARQLSGGEQQMLAITRAVLLGPRLLVLDEPTEGLAPSIVRSVAELVGALRAQGTAVVLMEQPGPFADSVADRVASMDRGVLSTAYDVNLPHAAIALTGTEGEAS